MDGNRAGSVDEQTGPNGPNVTQNPFDPAALLGYSQYAAALSSASTSVFPHMSSAFSLFPPPSAIFPTSSALPFGGLGSLGDGLLGTAAPPGLDAATGSTDWWRMAAARAQLASDSPSAAGFYTPGLAGGLTNPLLGSMFPGLVTPTTSSGVTVTSPATLTRSSPASSTTSHPDRQYASPSTAGAARRSKTSTPVQKVKHEPRSTHDADASPRRSASRRDSLSSPSSVDQTSSGAGLKPATDCQSLESSLLSAEAAMYASSSLFFPFALPHLLGASAASLPFPGLLPPPPPASTSTSSSTSPLPAAYSLPPLLPPPALSTPDDRAKSTGSSSKASTSPRVAPSPSRSSAGGGGRDDGARRPRSARNGDRPDSGGARSSRSVIVSPTPSAASDSEPPPLLLGPARNSAERRAGDVPGTSGWTWSSPTHSQHSSGLPQSPSHKQESGQSAGERLTSPAVGSQSDDAELTFSEVGAMDLSMKKPRRSSPSAIKPPPPAARPVVTQSAAPAASMSTAAAQISEQSMAEALTALLGSQQPGYGSASDQTAALAQLFAGQQLAAASGSELPLSLAAAAAATAGLFPPLFDGVSCLFYPPSLLAAMAGTPQGATPGGPTMCADKQASGSAMPATQRRSRGRRRGGRGRNSSVFISSLFPQQTTSSRGSRPTEDVRSGRGRGTRGRQGRGRGRQRSAEQQLPVAYMELENQHRQYLEQMLQQHLVQADRQPMTSSATSPAAAAAVTDAGRSASRNSRSSRSSASASGRSSQQQRSTLTSKLLHHQSKLEQALTAATSDAHVQDVTRSLALEARSGAALMSNFAALATGNHQLTAAASLHTDSDAGNEETSSAFSSDSEDGQSTRGSDASHAAFSGTDKRKQEPSEVDVPVKKRRRTILDETVLRIPLEQGWQRETRVRSFTPRKIIGEVVYITPCERKLRSYNEVDKFLEKGGISQLCRENFTFSTKVNIGKFYEQQTSDDGVQWVLLTDADVQERFVVIEERKKRIIENKLRAQLREEKRQKSEELLSKLAEARLQRKLEQQEMARKVAEMKLRKKAEKEHQREMLHRARQLRVMEVRRMKERQKLARQQERYHRQMQLRMEREMRTRQITEEKEVRRQHDVALKEQYERQQREKMELEESRKQAMVAMAMERERRRLDMLMAKALDARKKEEEKERLKAEKKNAKKLDKEKKLAQKRLELFLAREQRRPVEDMSIQDAKPLPEFDRIQGVRLSGKAFADCLMIVEFVHNFASILGFDADSIPTVNVLQGGLLNDEGYMREFFLFIKRLLKCATTDPGFVSPKEGVLMSGQKVVDMDVPENGVSEVLRLFIKSRSGHEEEMSRWLLLTPYYALNPTQKAGILSFICNELLCNKDINAEIEKNIDLVNNLRRDKWIIEGKLRKLRMLQAQRQRKMAQKTGTTPAASAPTSTAPSEDGNTTQNSAAAEMSTQVADTDADSDCDMSARQASAPPASHDSDAEEDKQASVEDLEAKIEKLLKQQNQLRERVFGLSHKLSAMSFGQDRYRRRYWVLPKCGGIFVEGLESGEPESADPSAPETDIKVEESVDKDRCFKPVTPPREDENSVKADETENGCMQVDSGDGIGDEVKQEPVTVNAALDPDECVHQSEQLVCDKPDITLSNNDKTESVLVKQETENVESVAAVDGSRTVKPELVSLNSLVGTDLKTNGEVSLTDFKNGFIDLKNCRRSSDESIKIEPFLPSAAVASNTQGTSALDVGEEVTEQTVSGETRSISVSDNPAESMTNDSIQSSLCCKSDIDQLPKTPSKDDVALDMRRSSILQLAVSSTGMGQQLPGVTSMQSFSVASSSQCPSQVATPTSEVSAAPQFDLSLSGTPLSFMPPSQTSTPSCLSTTFPDDLQLSADGELQPDYLAIPQNVQPISLAKQRGWWRITNPETVKELLNCLTMRGIRERSLQKNLERHLNFACQSCTKSKKTILKLEVTEASKRIASSPTSAPAPDDSDVWDFQLQCKMEMRVLEEIENLEERICSASLQTKGWKMEESAVSDKSTTLISNAERLVNPQHQQYIINVARSRLQSLERSIERRYLKPPLGRCNQLNLANLSSGGGSSSKDNHNNSSSDDESDTDDEMATRDLNSWRNAVSNATSAAQLSIYVAQLVRCIAWEKSIMKVLCQLCCRDDNEAQLLLCDMCDRGYHTYCIKPKLDNIPDGDWYCYECISKASGDQCCIACGRHGGRLVACEFCSRRVHLDCLEPPISRMPKKWTCYTCADERGKRKRSRPPTATSTPVKDSNSELNGAVKDAEDTNADQDTSQAAVPETSEPKPPAEEQTMPDSLTPVAVSQAVTKDKPSKASKDRSDRKRDRRKERKSEDGSPAVLPPDRASPVCNGTAPDDMNVCKAILSELREHSEAWPFLTPVNTKQFPTYRKVIRCPIDFQTIGRKLKTNTYKTHDEFCADVRLVFSNCEMFNEDDSQVGQAGHLMKQFFDSRWAELTGSGPTPSSLPS